MHCDLHTHSIFSDGSMTPTQIIRLAKQRNLVVALTDHNTAAGLDEFMRSAHAEGVTAVPGTEMSTGYEDKELHLLGLFISPEHYQAVERLAKESHVLKEISNMEMVERLYAAGYKIDYLNVKKRNPLGNANRAHIAAELMERGYVRSIDEAFSTLLTEEAGFYIPPARIALTDTIRFFRDIGAVPVLAHPLQELDEQYLRTLLKDAVAAGLIGMETQHSSYDEGKIALSCALAEEFGLLPSGGSDFHGSNKPGIELGIGKGNLSIPYSVYEVLRDMHASL